MSETAVADATNTATTDAAATDAGKTTAASTAGATTASTTATQQPWYSDWLKSDGTVNAKSYERLPDHLKALRPTLERQQNVEGILMALDHANSLAGKKALAPLPANSPPEVQAERKALLDQINGVPGKVSEYGITRPADIPEVQWNQGLADNFAAWCHKNSVSPAAAKELFAVQGNAVKGALAAQQANEAKFWTGEQQKFDALIAHENIAADRAAALVEKGALALGLNLEDAQTKVFLRGSLARTMAMRYAIATGESPTITGGTSAEGGGVDRDPMSLARDVQKNPSNPLHGPYHNVGNKFSRSDHDAAVEKVNGWFRQASDKLKSAGARR